MALHLAQQVSQPGMKSDEMAPDSSWRRRQVEVAYVAQQPSFRNVVEMLSSEAEEEGEERSR